MIRENHFYTFLSIAFLTLLGTFGCSETETHIDVPEIEVKVVGKGTDFRRVPYLSISVTNIGSTEARIVDVNIYLQKNGDLVGAARETVWYLEPGQTKVKRVKFFDL